MARRGSVDVSDLIRKRDDLIRLMGDAVLLTTQKLVLDGTKKLKEASPVDDGDFRDDWQPIVPSEPYQNGSIVNTMPYGPKLANGHSPQAPSGWIDNVVKEVVSDFNRSKK